MDAATSSSPLHVTIHPLPWASEAAPEAQQATSASSSGGLWGGDTPTFKDVLDTINPLQHIPIISNIYQSLTGDVPSTGANVVGGGLLGGPIGFASALFNEIIKSQTGKDVSGNLLALVGGESTTEPANTPAATQTADAQAPSPPGYVHQYAPSPTNLAAYSAYLHAKSMPA